MHDLYSAIFECAGTSLVVNGAEWVEPGEFSNSGEVVVFSLSFRIPVTNPPYVFVLPKEVDADLSQNNAAETVRIEVKNG